MNQLDQNDKQNLLLLIHFPADKIEEWFNTFSEDDRKYASELMSYYSAWLSEQSSAALKIFEESLGNPSQWNESRTLLESIMNRK